LPRITRIFPNFHLFFVVIRDFTEKKRRGAEIAEIYRKKSYKSA